MNLKTKGHIEHTARHYQERAAQSHACVVAAMDRGFDSLARHEQEVSAYYYEAA